MHKTARANFSRALLSIEALSIALPLSNHRIFGAQSVDLDIHCNEIVGLAGDAQSGNSLLVRAVAGLLPTTFQVTGKVKIQGESLLEAPESRQRTLRGTQMGTVFHDSIKLMHPSLRVGRHMEKVLELHTDLNTRARRERIEEILEEVGLSDLGRVMRAYPDELAPPSIQRMMIALAMILKPRILFADAPTDSQTSAEKEKFFDLLVRLKNDKGMSIVVVTQQADALSEIADRLVVMRDGAIVEPQKTIDVLGFPFPDYLGVASRMIA